MPYNFVVPSLTIRNFYNSFALSITPFEKQQKMFDGWKDKLEIICEHVLARKEGTLETTADTIENVVLALNLRDTLQKSVWLKA